MRGIVRRANAILIRPADLVWAVRGRQSAAHLAEVRARVLAEPSEPSREDIPEFTIPGENFGRLGPTTGAPYPGISRSHPEIVWFKFKERIIPAAELFRARPGPDFKHASATRAPNSERATRGRNQCHKLPQGSPPR